MQMLLTKPTSDDLFRGYGIEVTLKSKEDFLKVAETLTRIGLMAANKRCLYQSCHILHKQGRYAIMHFKEMFSLDGRHSSITESDIDRRTSIANLLHEWGLLTIVDKSKIISQPKLTSIKIISHADRRNWELVPKYAIGSPSR